MKDEDMFIDRSEKVEKALKIIFILAVVGLFVCAAIILAIFGYAVAVAAMLLL